jgi:DNA polymerase-1
VEPAVAARYLELYFKRHPKVKEYMDVAKEAAAKKRHVDTVLGRRIWFHGHGNAQAAARAAMNAPVQGSAADLFKLALLNVDRWFRDTAMESRITMLVHDELVLEMPEHEVDCLVESLETLMTTSVGNFNIPIKVNVAVGGNLAALQAIPSRS